MMDESYLSLLMRLTVNTVAHTVGLEKTKQGDR